MFKTRLLSGILLVIIALATIISGGYEDREKSFRGCISGSNGIIIYYTGICSR